MAAHKLEKHVRTRDVLASENISFKDLHLTAPVLRGLTKAGFEKPSPIQLKAIPLGRCGLGKWIMRASILHYEICLLFLLWAREVCSAGVDEFQCTLLGVIFCMVISIARYKFKQCTILDLHFNYQLTLFITMTGCDTNLKKKLCVWSGGPVPNWSDYTNYV